MAEKEKSKKTIEKANEEAKLEEDVKEKTVEKKANDKVQEVKKEKPKEIKVEKKTEAVSKGTSYPISKKHAMYICNFIKNQPIDKAISDLHKVIKLKQAVPFKGEIPHRKGISGPGRYPVKAAGYFINLLKALKGNSLVNGLDLDLLKVHYASASWAARPARAGGRAGKRTNIILKAKEFKKGESK
ncbi:MAG: uL22 family ribosomal protein [Nanoarchaeota archaeon]